MRRSVCVRQRYIGRGSAGGIVRARHPGGRATLCRIQSGGSGERRTVGNNYPARTGILAIRRRGARHGNAPDLNPAHPQGVYPNERLQFQPEQHDGL